LHACAIAGARWFLPRAFGRSAARAVYVSVETDLVPHAGVIPAGPPASERPARPPPSVHQFSSGPAREPRPDTRRAGRGGTRRATERALRLSDSVDGLTLDADPALFTSSSQLSRVDTADERRSREDRRTTPNPMELTFLASGTGSRLQRLLPAHVDPAEGSFGAVPVAPGVRAGTPDPSEDPVRSAPLGSEEPGAVTVPARGVDRGSRRDDYRRSAAVALARPSIRQGRASVATTNRGRPNDTVDSRQEVASAVQSLITASSAGGPLGKGPGGTVGEGEPGAEGTVGPGMRSSPSGDGGIGESAAPLGIESYVSRVTRKVYPYWEDAFPLWARLEGRGAVAIIGVTILADGTIRDVHVVRPSGIPEFDRNVEHALEAASPYGPLPPRIRDAGLTLHIAFDAMNPAVGRLGPGPGRR
jgi:TonB family protein